MPRFVSEALMNAKRSGAKKCNLIHFDFESAKFLTDNAFNVKDDSNNTYAANGLLLNVTPGAMTSGDEANDWTVTLSIVNSDTLNEFLGVDYHRRWVYHYVLYFLEDEDGLTPVGIESRKFGRILRASDKSNNNIAELEFTITSPFGDDEEVNVVKTNPASHHRHFGIEDNVFQFAHEVGYEVQVPDNRGDDGVPPIDGGDLP